jgi:starch-binding outer membrane protein, SusD/RagB family
MKNYILLLMIATIGTLNFHCNKAYLDKRPLGEVDETALANKKGVEGLLIGAYSLLDGYGSSKNVNGYAAAASNWVYGSICGSEAYKGGQAPDDQYAIDDMEKFSSDAFNVYLLEKWGVLYDGIQRSNDVLRIMVKANDLSTDEQKLTAAEARFLRAHYHFEAKKIWNNIPVIDETITYENGNYHVSNQVDAWPFIENDLIYALDNLKDPDPATPGRANKYTAMALLAKAYMFQKKFGEAKPLLDSIINSGKYQLMNNYHDNFNPQTKNREESIMSAQSSVNDHADGRNGNYGDVLNFPQNGGPGGCCGFFRPSQYLINHFKTDPVTGLPDPDHFNDVDVKHDNGLLSTDPFTPDSGSLDPRLDWTIGRRAIPYLDWGNHPGAYWMTDTSDYGPYSPKKNVFAKSQQSSLTDLVWSNFTANNINLIRYADVLLWAAEVEAESNSLDKAEYYVNMVRNRMAEHHEGWVHKYLDDNNPERGFYNDDAHLAANYKIEPYPNGYFASHGRPFALKAIRYERMLELGMEGQRFFDLVRWGIANTEINTYLQKEKIARIHLKEAMFKNGISEYFPIPQTQIDLSAGADGIPKMKQNPGY